MLVLKANVILSDLALVVWWVGHCGTAIVSSCRSRWSSRAAQIEVLGTLSARVCFPCGN